MKAEFPALLLASMQILTMGYSRSLHPRTASNRVYPICFENGSNPAARPTIVRFMKARVYVSMKPTVLDPQGQTIRGALNSMGHKEIASVRQGKYFEIGIADGTPRDSAATILDEIARDVLANPVIEEYRVEILD